MIEIRVDWKKVHWDFNKMVDWELENLLFGLWNVLVGIAEYFWNENISDHAIWLSNVIKKSVYNNLREKWHIADDTISLDEII